MKDDGITGELLINEQVLISLKRFPFINIYKNHIHLPTTYQVTIKSYQLVNLSMNEMNYDCHGHTIKL